MGVGVFAVLVSKDYQCSAGPFMVNCSQSICKALVGYIIDIF